LIGNIPSTPPVAARPAQVGVSTESEMPFDGLIGVIGTSQIPTHDDNADGENPASVDKEAADDLQLSDKAEDQSEDGPVLIDGETDLLLGMILNERPPVEMSETEIAVPGDAGMPSVTERPLDGSGPMESVVSTALLATLSDIVELEEHSRTDPAVSAQETAIPKTIRGMAPLEASKPVLVPQSLAAGASAAPGLIPNVPADADSQDDDFLISQARTVENARTVLTQTDTRKPEQSLQTLKTEAAGAAPDHPSMNSDVDPETESGTVIAEPDAEDVPELVLPSTQSGQVHALSGIRAVFDVARFRSPIVQNVASHLQTLDLDEGSVTIRLKPHGLGVIEVEIARGMAGQMEIAMRIQNPMVLEALRAERNTITELLSGQGAGNGSLSMDLFQSGSEGQDRNPQAAGETGSMSGAAVTEEDDLADVKTQDEKQHSHYGKTNILI